MSKTETSIPSFVGQKNPSHLSALQLLNSRQFLPLFITQFLGALNDNILKNALVILVTFGLAKQLGNSVNMIVVLAGACFILPFFVFSATAGRIADKYEMSRLVVIIKTAEIGIMVVATIGFLTDSVVVLLSALTLMGAHSTFFGPLKYGLLPHHLQESELLTGNALIESGTFLAILIGTITGGILIETSSGRMVISGLLLVVAILGLVASLFIPRAEPAAPALKLGFNIAADTWQIIREASAKRNIWLSIMGISWFWLAGATVLSQFPALAKDVLSADNQVVTLFLTVFSLGIGAGSILCSSLLKGNISAKYVPIGALGISIFTAELYFASRGFVPVAGHVISISEFLSSFSGWRILIDLLMIAVSGGLYVVPLYTILQARSEPGHVSRTIAANNILNAAFMTVAALATIGLLALKFSVPDLFLILSGLNLAVAIYIYKV